MLVRPDILRFSHTFGKPLLEMSISSGIVKSLAIVGQGSSTINVKNTHENPTDPSGPWKYLL